MNQSSGGYGPDIVGEWAEHGRREGVLLVWWWADETDAEPKAMANMVEGRVEWLSPWVRDPDGVMPRRVADAVRVLRHLPDRLLHRWRYRQAVVRLGRTSAAGRLVFVCHGNLCRSPYAEVAFRTMLGGVGRTILRVQSAGFGPTGRPAPPEAQTIAAARGVTLAAHRSRRVTADLIARAALVLVMNAEQSRRLRRQFRVPRNRMFVLGDLDGDRIETREIRDPMSGSAAVFEASYARIDRCLRTLAQAIGVWEGDHGGPK